MDPGGRESQAFGTADWGLLLAAAGIWGTSFLLMAIELESLEPSVVTFGRVSIGALALWILPSGRTRVPRDAWGRICLLGLTWMAFPLSMFPIAQQWIDSSVAGMLNAAMPIATVAIAGVLFKIPTNPRQLVGIAIGLVGIVGIALPTAKVGETTALGVVLVVLAVVSYGLAINVAVPLQATHGTAPVLARALVVASVLTLPLAAADTSFGRTAFTNTSPSGEPGWDTLAAALVLGVFGSGYAFLFASQLGQRVGPVRTSIITYLVPIFSIVLGVAVRDENISPWAVAGTALVLLGAGLTTRPAKETTPDG